MPAKANMSNYPAKASIHSSTSMNAEISIQMKTKDIEEKKGTRVCAVEKEADCRQCFVFRVFNLLKHLMPNKQLGSIWRLVSSSSAAVVTLPYYRFYQHSSRNPALEISRDIANNAPSSRVAAKLSQWREGKLYELHWIQAGVKSTQYPLRSEAADI